MILILTFLLFKIFPNTQGLFSCSKSICNKFSFDSYECANHCKTLLNGKYFLNDLYGYSFLNLNKIPDDAFNDLDLQELWLINSARLNISSNAFRGVKKIEIFYIKNVSSIQTSCDKEQISHLKNKINQINIRRSLPKVNDQSISYILELANKLNIHEFNLEYVDLYNLSCDLTNLTEIRNLTLKHDQLEYISLNISKYLSYLDLSSNKLVDLKIEFDHKNETSNLKYLLLNSNSFECLKLTNLTNLIHIELSNNKFKLITNETFYLTSNLRSIDLSHNFIYLIDENSFLNLKQLNYLDLSQNKLGDNIRLMNIDLVECLLLRKNQFKIFTRSILKNPLSLRELDLSSNLIEFIDLNITSLEIILLANNRLKQIDKSIHLPNIIKFDISYNTKLTFNDNHDDTILADNLSNMVELIWSNCKLKNLTINFYETMNKLKRLELDKNDLDEENVFFESDTLIELNLIRNKFKFIKNNTFKYLKNLAILRLSFNLIRSIESNSFEYNTNLKQLYLNNNYLNSILDLSYFNLLQLLNMANQNKNLDSIGENVFETLPNNQNLTLILSLNIIKNLSTQTFCNKKSKLKLKEFIVENLTLMNKCQLEQFESNTLINSYTKVDCDLRLMSKRLNISLIDNNENETECIDYVLNDDCNYEKNLKYDCSYDLDEFKRDSIYFIGIIENLNQLINETIYCFSNKYFRLKCFFNRTNSIIRLDKVEIEIKINNEKIIFNPFSTNFNNSDIFVIKQVFETVFLDVKKIRIFYHMRTETLILLHESNSFYSLIVKSSKYFLSKNTGLLFDLNLTSSFTSITFINDLLNNFIHMSNHLQIDGSNNQTTNKCKYYDQIEKKDCELFKQHVISFNNSIELFSNLNDRIEYNSLLNRSDINKYLINNGYGISSNGENKVFIDLSIFIFFSIYYFILS